MTGNDPYLNADNVGGGSIENFPGSTLNVDEPGLFALDILDAPNLEVLHLKRLKSGKRLHLVLSNLPKLHRVILPSGHPGAIVHINSEKTPPPLIIQGMVSEIDAAWEQVQFRMEAAPKLQHWSSVFLCAPEKRLPTPSGHGLVVVTGDMPDDLGQLTLDSDNDWLITAVRGLRHVQISTSGQTALQKLPNLRTVNSSGQGLNLSIDDAPNLERIAGTGELVSVRQPNNPVNDLTIADQWQQASIRSSRLEILSFINGASLTLHHCYGLQHVDLPLGIDVECRGALPLPLINTARFYFDESSLKASFDRYRQGDQSQLPTLLSILAKAHEQDQVVLSLQRLHELCQLGVPAGKIWQARRELAARHRDNRWKKKQARRPFNEAAMVKADVYWRWTFPNDLAQQGWEADLKVWLYCQANVPEAQDYAHAMACTCCNETALEVLIRLGGETKDDTALRGLAMHSMAEYLSKGDDYLLHHNRNTGQDPTLRLMRLLIPSSIGQENRCTVIAFLCDVLPLEKLVKSIPPVVHREPGLFRHQFMILARKPEEWFTNRMVNADFYHRDQKLARYRQQLLQIALAPCTSEEEEDEKESKAGVNYSLFEEDA